MDGVKVALGNRGMKVEAARKIGKSGEPWYICNSMSSTAAIFAWLCVLSHRPLVLWWLSPGCGSDRGGMPLHDAVLINCKTGATTEYQGADVKYMF